MEAGVSNSEAKRDICRAIADRKIKVRTPVELITRTIVDHQFNNRFAWQYQRFARQFHEGTRRLDMPSRLKPRDLCWRESRFKSTRLFQPGMKGYPGPPREWEIWIEFRSEDVTKLLCPGQQDANEPQAATTNESQAGRATRPQAVTAAQETAAIKALASHPCGSIARITAPQHCCPAGAHGPAELPQIIKQRDNFSLRDRIVFKPRDHHADAALELLRAGEQRACRGQSGNYFDEIAPSHCLPQARDHPNVGLQLRRLQQENATGEIGLDGLFCAAAIQNRACLLWVKTRIYRIATLTAGSPQ
jgi:hypothetical protein